MYRTRPPSWAPVAMDVGDRGGEVAPGKVNTSGLPLNVVELHVLYVRTRIPGGRAL